MAVYKGLLCQLSKTQEGMGAAVRRPDRTYEMRGVRHWKAPSVASGVGCVTMALCVGNQGSWLLHPNAESSTMRKIIHYIDQLSNKIVPNSPAQTRAGHQVSLPYSNTALLSPSYPTGLGTSILIDPSSEDSLINHARQWISEKLTHRRRCTFLVQLPVTTADRCRPGRHAP
jgi:hypothetical protein